MLSVFICLCLFLSQSLYCLFVTLIVPYTVSLHCFLSLSVFKSVSLCLIKLSLHVSLCFLFFFCLYMSYFLSICNLLCVSFCLSIFLYLSVYLCSFCLYMLVFVPQCYLCLSIFRSVFLCFFLLGYSAFLYFALCLFVSLSFFCLHRVMIFGGGGGHDLGIRRKCIKRGEAGSKGREGNVLRGGGGRTWT